MKDNLPLVSVIMPLYNKRLYVRRAVESVLQQTYERWELLVVDDGSTDGSKDEVPRNDKRIRLLTQDNRGPAAARNRGILMASGYLITFIDADDFYYPDKLEKEIEILWKEQKADWMISAHDHESGGFIRTKYILDDLRKEIKGEPAIFEGGITQLTVAGWHVNGLCMKKDCCYSVGGFREDMKCNEITEFIIRCILKHPNIVVYPQPLYRVVDVPGSAYKLTQHRIEGMRLMGESLFKLSKEYPEHSSHLMARGRKLHYSYSAAMILSGEATEARKFLSKEFYYSHDKRWWKMFIGTWLPKWVIRVICTE